MCRSLAVQFSSICEAGTGKYVVYQNYPENFRLWGGQDKYKTLGTAEETQNSLGKSWVLVY
jgi:hypothetical protein